MPCLLKGPSITDPSFRSPESSAGCLSRWSSWLSLWALPYLLITLSNQFLKFRLWNFTSSPRQCFQQFCFVSEGCSEDKNIRDSWWWGCRCRSGAGGRRTPGGYRGSTFLLKPEGHRVFLTWYTHLSLSNSAEIRLVSSSGSFGPCIYLTKGGGQYACNGKLNSVVSLWNWGNSFFSAWKANKKSLVSVSLFPPKSL